MREAVIVDAVRTPIGRGKPGKGALNPTHPVDLLAHSLRAVVDRIVPQLVVDLAGRPLKIWSVPCASGEEPLTLAMLLDEQQWFARAPIEIVGSDASRAAVDTARRGRYGARSFRNCRASCFSSTRPV